MLEEEECLPPKLTANLLHHFASKMRNMQHLHHS